jgi:glutamate-1-semialdehyde 2,1-aminomutase
MADSISRELFARAVRVIPGGVNSPVRAFRAVGGEPVFFREAKGAHLVAADGTRYVDCVGSWGPAILGHAHDDVIAAVRDAAGRGLSFGAPTELEVRFAEALLRLYPSMGKVRAVSSGTEATMSALRVARGFTKREVIVKFEGCYHGHADALLVKAGSGLATLGVPDSAGVAVATAASTATLPYNDLTALHELFAARGAEIAAVIVEPVVGNMGCVPPEPGFLEAIIELCERHGAVSIFDEVMTGCRLAPGGAQERFKLRPAMTCLGKVVGGGMPLAAFGGRTDIMDMVAPVGPVYQAGTLSGNPISVSSGLATLERLTPALYEHLEAMGRRLEEGLERGIRDANKGPARVQRVGSMLTLFFGDGPVRSWADAERADRNRFASWHAGLLARGVYWPPSQFEAAFLSGAHTPELIDQIVKASAEALAASSLEAFRNPDLRVGNGRQIRFGEETNPRLKSGAVNSLGLARRQRGKEIKAPPSMGGAPSPVRTGPKGARTPPGAGFESRFPECSLPLASARGAFPAPREGRLCVPFHWVSTAPAERRGFRHRLSRSPNARVRARARGVRAGPPGKHLRRT